MRKFLMGLIVALIAIALSAGSLPANASSGDSVTVESVSYAETSAKANVKSETQALIGGATQLTWEEPNHSIAVTSKQLKKAVKIKVNATGANSSKVIYKKAKAKLFKKYKKTMPKWKAKKKAVKGSRIVILKEGSCVRNTGRRNALRVGFVWCPDAPVVLKYDAKSNQYRHTHTLLTASGLEALKQELASQGRLDELEVVGTVVRDGVTYYIVKWCFNYIGGNVVMVVKVVQVRFPANILMDVELESAVDVVSTVKASLVCPSGTLYAEASASASGYAATSFSVLVKNKDAKVADEKERILLEARAKAKTMAKAAAQAKVKLECGSTPPPPPPVTPEPEVVVNEINDVLEYNYRPVDFSLTGQPGENLQVTAYAKHGGSITAGKVQTITLDSKGNATGTLEFTAGEVTKSALDYYIEETKYTIAAGKDVIWLQVRDSHGNTVWAKSNDFDIIAPQPDPQ